jgi:uncharacterized delta-60 repeat protein
VKRLAILCGLALLALGPLGVSSAARLPLAGGLDPTFGSGGAVTQSAGSSIGGIAVQRDGKIVVVGRSVFARYNPDGSLDPSFGSGAYAAIGFAADAVALEPDGKIVVAGSAGPVNDAVLSEFALARYDANGSLDASFGTDGIAKTVIPEPTPYCGWCGWNAGAAALAVLPGGDIVAAGTVWGGPDPAPPDSPGWSSFFALTRYTPDGSLDSTFGDAGIVQTAFNQGFGFGLAPELSGIAVQPDGKIVATGSASFGGHGVDEETMVLARYEPDGALDAGFGAAGTATTDLRRLYGGGPPTLQRGRILVAGWTLRRTASGWTYFPLLARYEASGRLDSTFGTRGFAQIDAHTEGGALGGANAILAQHDGKILVADSYTQGPPTVARLLPNGRLDPSFGRGGLVAFRGQPSSLALQANGKVLVAGVRANAGTLVRLIGGNNCVVPELRGKTVSQARASLVKSYCRRGSVSRRFSSKVKRGRVISAAAARGARLAGGTKIQLLVSKGRAR